ncbi:hypothetical protein [Empedobacter falsenii]|uniref:hypothetical protein n=1 Tax=Empedobacter falsenii TaxID=343874 RepID=UPI001C5606B5|nr:hypothetical protein [Empedobacter falsenii]MBW1619730.1 hypothetical protein [Empedobacter falsenii]
MKRLVFTLGFMLIGTFTFASSEKIEVSKIEESKTIVQKEDCEAKRALTIEVFEEANLGLSSNELIELGDAMYNIYTFSSMNR